MIPHFIHLTQIYYGEFIESHNKKHKHNGLEQAISLIHDHGINGVANIIMGSARTEQI